MTKQMESYLKALKRRLWWRGLFDPDELEEVESHLLEAVEASLRRGLNVDESERLALERFGSVKVVSLAFEKERNNIRGNIMQKILLTIAILSGLFLAYVEASPNWDDTGLLVISLLVSAGLLTLLGHTRPWLVALAVGAWIPIRYIFQSQDLGMLIVLLFPLVGAYTGWVIRSGATKIIHTVNKADHV